MRRCRSNSPLRSSCCPSRTCCPPGCCKPCCLPTRRCRSSSPRRSSCRPLYAGSCYDPCGPCNPCGPWDACEQVCCSPRRRRCYPRKTCSPYSPRRCPPCAPGRCSVSPSCYTPSRCDPCLQRQCEPCYPWRYDSYYRSSICEPCDPCYPSTCGPCDPCDPCYPKRYTSCYPKSCGPCYPKKGSACDSCCDTSCYSCFPWRYRSTRSYSPSVCDPCYPRSRDSCLPRKCSSYKPCYSPTCSMCFPSSCKSRCLSPCSDCPVEERIVKSGRIVCDTFSKVCYPCDRPISRYGLNVCGNCKVDPCCCSFNPPYKATPTCQVAKISSPCEPPDEGPSCDFLDKSRKLGKCLNRYDPHYCPWEADISVSGTIRGHCSSTAAEVARRMTGRFKSRGERYTTDSLAKKTCPDEPQKMSLGMLDDGTVLNLSRNNKPTTAKDGYNETTNRSHSSVRIMSPPDGNGARGSRRNRKLRRYDKENESEEENRSSSEETTPPNQVVRGPRFCEYSYKNRKVADTSPSDHRVSSHRSNNKNRADYVDSHRTSGLRSMRYRSGNEVSDYRTGSDRSGSNSPCTEVRSFLDGRRSRRLSERNRASSMRGEPSRESRARSLSSHRSPGDSIRLHVSPNTHSLNVTSSRHSTSDDSRSFSPPSYAPRRNNRLKRDDGGKSYKSSRYSRTLEDKSNRLSEPGRNPRRVSRADAYQRSRWSRRESESKSNLSDSREYPPYHHHHPHDYRSCLSSRERPWRSRKKRVTYQYAEGD